MKAARSPLAHPLTRSRRHPGRRPEQAFLRRGSEPGGPGGMGPMLHQRLQTQEQTPPDSGLGAEWTLGRKGLPLPTHAHVP